MRKFSRDAIFSLGSAEKYASLAPLIRWIRKEIVGRKLFAEDRIELTQ